jgi:hypothetical protein
LAQKATDLAAALGTGKATASGNTVTLTDDVEINAEVEVPYGVVLKVGHNKLTVEDGATLTNSGTIELGERGTITKDPSGSGTITNSGTVKTSTTTGATLKTILDNVTSGNIIASEDITAIEDGTQVRGTANLTITGEVAVSGTATLTVADTATLINEGPIAFNAGSNLKVENGAKVEVKGPDGELDLSALETDEGSVTLKDSGTIEVSGTLKLPAPNADDYEVTQIDYGTSSIKINAGGKVYMKSTAAGSPPDDYYIGPDGESAKYTWGTPTNPASSVEFKKDGEMVLTGNLTSAADNAINTKVTINQNAKLTVKGGTTLTIGSTGELAVENTGSVIVEGTLVSEDNSKGTLNGTVTVKSGGILKDRNPSGGSLWTENGPTSGSIIFESGAKAYGPVDEIALIDTADCAPAATIFELGGASTLTLKKEQFILDGTATVHGTYSIAVTNGLTIKAGSTLTVNNSWSNDPANAINFLWVTSSINGEPAENEKAASKLVSQTTIIYGNGNTNVPKFYKADGSAAYGATGPAQPDHISVELGTYNWDAAAGGGATAGWKKQ